MIEKTNTQYVLESAIKIYGETSQVDKMIEEMSELTKALLKYRLSPDSKTEADVREEMADVEIMLQQMKIIYGDCGSDIAQKISRLSDRLHLPVEQPDPTPLKPVEKKEQTSRVERLFGKKSTWPAQTAAPAAPEEKQKTEAREFPKGYKGFLLIRCPECGNLHSMFSKNHITYTTCACGHRIDLQELIPAYMECAKCGNSIKYRTNIHDDYPAKVACLKCRATIDLQMNPRGTALVTVSSQRRGGYLAKPKSYWKDGIKNTDFGR